MDGEEETLYIPICESSEAVSVPVNKLPDDFCDITDVLKLELAPLDLWLKFAVEYFKRGKEKQFEEILLEATGPDAQEAYRDDVWNTSRINIINTLAAYYTQKSLRESDPEVRRRLWEQATEHYNNSAYADFEIPMTWVGKGLLQLAKGEVQNADSSFQNALSIKGGVDNIPALLGKACTSYHLGQYKDALESYRKALLANPALPGYVRVGIGHCYFAMQDFSLARRAFNRVLQLEPDNVEALVALAVLDLNNAADNDIHTAMSYVWRALESDARHPRVLALLANHFFFADSHAKVVELANKALRHCDLDKGKVEGEAYFQLARAYHIQGDLGRARGLYDKALSKVGDAHAPAAFGAAQMMIYAGNLEGAVKVLTKLNNAYPDDFDVLRVLGSVLGQTGKHEDARKHLKRASSMSPTNVELLVELAQVSERHEPLQAQAGYEKVVKILTELKLPVPTQIWNNCGLLHHKLGDYGKAREAYKKALKTFDLEDPDSPVVGEDVTVVYNIALVLEAEASFDQAIALYDKILLKFPDYLDCYLRKADLSRSWGRFDEARAFIRQALDRNHLYPGAHTLLANICMDQGDLENAAKCCKHILHHVQPNDAYTQLLLGSIEFQQAVALSHKVQKNPTTPAPTHSSPLPVIQSQQEKDAQAQALMGEATTTFRSVLAAQPLNTFAAVGLGAVLAYRGHTQQAKEIFTQVRDNVSKGADVLLNLAHIYISEKQNANALKLYQSILEKHFPRDVNVMLYLARALYLDNQMKQCKTVLLKAIHLAPMDDLLWYNLAIAQEEFAIGVLRTSKSARTCQEVEMAVADLNHALTIYHRLSTSAIKIISTKAKAHYIFCKDAIKSSAPHLEYARQREEEHNRLKEDSERARLELVNKAEIEKEMRRREEEESREKLERIAREKKEQLEHLQNEWAQEEAAVRAREEAKKKKRDGDDDEEGEGGEGEAQPAKQKKEKRKRTKAEKPEKGKKKKAATKEIEEELFGGLSEDEKQEVEAQEAAAAANDRQNDDDDGDDGGISKRRKKLGKKGRQGGAGGGGKEGRPEKSEREKEEEEANDVFGGRKEEREENGDGEGGREEKGDDGEEDALSRDAPKKKRVLRKGGGDSDDEGERPLPESPASPPPPPGEGDGDGDDGEGEVQTKRKRLQRKARVLDSDEDDDGGGGESSAQKGGEEGGDGGTETQTQTQIPTEEAGDD